MESAMRGLGRPSLDAQWRATSATFIDAQKKVRMEKKNGWSRIVQSERGELGLPLLGHQPIAFENRQLFIIPRDLFP